MFDVSKLTGAQGDLLRDIAAGEASGNKMRLTRDEAVPLMEMQLINVTADPGMNDGKASAHLLETGRWAIAAPNLPTIRQAMPTGMAPAASPFGTFAGIETVTDGAGIDTVKKVVGQPSAPRTDVTVDIDYEVPTKPRAAVGRKPSGDKPGGSWPFDSLTVVGASFHIPATPAKPEPWKTYSSLRQVGMDRYRVPVMGPDGKQVQEQKTLSARTSKKTGEVTPARTVMRLKYEYPREFTVVEAAPNDKAGKGARVKRTK